VFRGDGYADDRGIRIVDSGGEIAVEGKVKGMDNNDTPKRRVKHRGVPVAKARMSWGFANLLRTLL